jgi:P-type Ca2+ transporter type 2C
VRERPTQVSGAVGESSGADGTVAAEAPWMAAEAVVDALGSDAGAGLGTSEAEERLAAWGPNELDEVPVRPVWRLLLAQFANTMIVVLLIAALVMVAIGEVRDALVVAVILVLNAAIGFVQEFRAERTMAALRTLTGPSARVIRGGVEMPIPARALVPGDLLLLEAGDVVPADARLLHCPGLRVDEATLTGESVPVDKEATALTDRAGAVADQLDMVFRGTAVVHGRARAVVVATGMATQLGGIAGLLARNTAPRTPLQRRLAALGRQLAAAALVVCAVVFALGVARGEDTVLMLLTAISLAVAAIPEALPAVVTISLALGAQRMARHHALVRRLPAVETLGSVTVICTDKTGTLTQARMQVEWVWTTDGEIEVTGSGYDPAGELLIDGRPIGRGDRPALTRLLTAATLCNDSTLQAPAGSGGVWDVAGDPTEGALLVLAAKAGVGPLDATLPRVGELAFDATRKRMTTLHRPGGPGDGLVATKGALESVLDVTTHVASPGGDIPFSADLRSLSLTRAEDYAARGYRVLAFAGRRLEPGDLPADARVERDLTLYGLVAMADPARPESAAAVASCRRAGITPVMITGDHPATAAAIAARMGIADDGEVLSGAELAREGTAGLATHVDRVAVYARTNPEQKLDIVQAWQARGEIVAMTGDGVNDAPALRTADIGVAMGLAGTEVAKQAADMVLTDDDFATIVTAVGEGRRIYDNIQRFVRYTLTSNSGEIWVMLLGPFVGLPLPLLPVQILWVNLVTDGLPGLALAVEPAERDAMRRPPRVPAEGIFARGMWQHILLVGLLMGVIPLGLGIWGSVTGRPWQTMVFTSLALLQLGHALAVRSGRDSLRTLGLATNRPLFAAVAGTIALQFAVVYSAWGQALFRTSPLDVLELAVVLVASTGVLWAVEAEKLVRRRRLGTSSPRPAPAGPGSSV